MNSNQMEASSERFYEAEYPSIDQVVMVRVTSVGEAMNWCHLLEYGRPGLMVRQCFLQGRGTTRRYQRRVGQELCLYVLRVEPETGFIDLSPRRVTAAEVKACTDKYHKNKKVHGILHHVAVSLGLNETDHEELVRRTAWFLDQEPGQCPAYTVFRRAVSDPSVLDGCDIDEKTREALLHVIRLKLSPPTVWIRSVVKVTCFTKEGVDAIRRALKAGKDANTNSQIRIHVVASPEYELSTQTSEVEEGKTDLKLALCQIEDSILRAGGEFKIIKQASVRLRSYWESERG